jgi:hypothetical protein
MNDYKMNNACINAHKKFPLGIIDRYQNKRFQGGIISWREKPYVMGRPLILKSLYGDWSSEFYCLL